MNNSNIFKINYIKIVTCFYKKYIINNKKNSDIIENNICIYIWYKYLFYVIDKMNSIYKSSNIDYIFKKNIELYTWNINILNISKNINEFINLIKKNINKTKKLEKIEIIEYFIYKIFIWLYNHNFLLNYTDKKYSINSLESLEFKKTNKNSYRQLKNNKHYDVILTGGKYKSYKKK